MLRAIQKSPLNLTADKWRRYLSSSSPPDFISSDSTATRSTKELTRVPRLPEGCDYEHWLVVMATPGGYPPRDEIVNGYVKTLATALGSEEAAKRSIYSVSTKYYYAFGCKIPENLTYRIRTLPNVKWVLPDSYLCSHGENKYGGEPFVDGDVVPYDDKYHTDWIRDTNDDGKCESLDGSKKFKRKNIVRMRIG